MLLSLKDMNEVSAPASNFPSRYVLSYDCCAAIIVNRSEKVFYQVDIKVAIIIVAVNEPATIRETLRPGFEVGSCFSGMTVIVRRVAKLKKSIERWAAGLPNPS